MASVWKTFFLLLCKNYCIDSKNVVLGLFAWLIYYFCLFIFSLWRERNLCKWASLPIYYFKKLENEARKQAISFSKMKWTLMVEKRQHIGWKVKEFLQFSHESANHIVNAVVNCGKYFYPFQYGLAIHFKQHKLMVCLFSAFSHNHTRWATLFRLVIELIKPSRRFLLLFLFNLEAFHIWFICVLRYHEFTDGSTMAYLTSRTFE